MVFSDPIFLFLFLPIVLLVYWTVARRFRNFYIVLIGAIFYMWSGGAFIWLLGGTIFFAYLSGELIYRSSNQRFKTIVLTSSIAFTVGSLVFWKYSAFVMNQLLSAGLRSGEVVHIALPIAISFFTFQCVSYVVDVYLARCHPAKSFIDFAAYILLFPHLIAGPIVRYADIETELSTKKVKWLQDFEIGAPRFFWGLAKKILIADQAAVIAKVAFSLPNDQIGFLSAWTGTIAFTIQIYFDFSGYSDMAIGLARMFGFTFLENFKRPYSSISITDFWRRWHISLSSWFRDYVYIPLGGNRASPSRTYLNLGIVFFLTGIWHGANWTFLLWGLFHGTFLILERVTGLWEGSMSRVITYLRRIFTLVVVALGWVLFRAVDLVQARYFYTAMFSYSTKLPIALREVLSTQRVLFAALGLMVVLVGGSESLGSRISYGMGTSIRTLRVFIIFVLAPLSLIYSLSSDFSPFLYFQF